MTASNAGTTLRTLSRGLEVLEAIAAADGTASAKSLARQLDLNRSTCYHILRTLQEDGFVTRLPKGTYIVGSRAARLSKTVADHTRPDPTLSALLSRLHRLTRETVYISGWYHGTVTLQEWIAGLHMLNVGNLDVGYTGNMHARASCKAILSHLPLRDVDAMLPDDSFTQLTPNTIRDHDALAAELKLVAQRGYAVDAEEYEVGVSCVAAPFFDAAGRPSGAFAVSAPTSRFNRDLGSLSTHVRDVAHRATAYLRTTSPTPLRAVGDGH